MMKVETGVMCWKVEEGPQAKEQGSWKRARTWALPQSLQREPALLMPRLQPNETESGLLISKTARK